MTINLNEQIRQIGADNSRADTIAQANSATDRLALEAQNLLKDHQFTSSLEGPNSPVPGMTVIKDEAGNPKALEIFVNGHALDFYDDGTTKSNELIVKRDSSGKPVSYEKDGDSLAFHADRNEWYYNSSTAPNKFVEVDAPTEGITGFLFSSGPSVDIRNGSVSINDGEPGEFQLGQHGSP